MCYVDLGESFHTSIYYLLAKIGFDTAENEPAKNCKFATDEGFAGRKARQQASGSGPFFAFEKIEWSADVDNVSSLFPFKNVFRAHRTKDSLRWRKHVGV